MPAWTTPKTWATDEVLTAADLNTQVRDNTTHLEEWIGELDDGYAQAVADSGTFTTSETQLLSISPTVPVGGRNVKITAQTRLVSTVSGDRVALRIKESTTVLMERIVRLGSTSEQDDGPVIVRLAAPAFGGHTYTLNAVRVSGTGTITAKAAAANPMFILAESL